MSEAVQMHTMLGKKCFLLAFFAGETTAQISEYKPLHICILYFFLYMHVQMYPEFKHTVYTDKEFKIFYRDTELS